MNREHLSRAIAAVALLGTAGAAHAHPGHGLAGGLTDGLVHPLSGLDHLLALIAVGLWAAQQGGRAARLLPAGFLAALAAGFGLALGGVGLPAVEPVVAASVLLLGLAVGGALRAPAAVGVPVVAAFGLWHGYAHGGALSLGAPALAAGAGMLIGSAMLLGLAVLGGARSARGMQPLVRAGGLAIGAAGAVLLAGV